MDTTDPDVALMVANVRASHWFDYDSASTVSSVPLTRIAEVPVLGLLLLSNDHPNAAQYTAARALLEQHNTALSRVQFERSEVEFAIRALSGTVAIGGLTATRLTIINEEHALRAEIRMCRTVISPIRRLPPEIIQEIFLFFTPSLDLSTSPHDREWSPFPKVQIPWYLGHICRSWREIALSLGVLWSVFDATSIIHPHKLCPSSHIPSAALCLQRSGPAPISIRVSDPKVDNDDITLLMDMFAEHVHRLKRVDLIFLPDNVLWQFGNNFNPLCRPLPPKTSFPSLTVLTLTGITLPSHARLSFPWTQLLNYQEASCHWPSGWDDRWSSYSQLLKLIDLSVEFGSRVVSVDPPGRLLLPNVRKARIVLFGKQHFLHLFEMPSLRTLVYDHHHHNFSEDDSQAPTIHLPHSMAYLRVLQVLVDRSCKPSSSLVPSIDFSNILNGSPHLAVLSISIPHLVVDTLVASLLPSEHQTALGQRLVTVCLEEIRCNNHRDFENMLQARFEPPTENVTAIRSFTLVNPEPRSFREQMMDSAVRFRRKGWTVTVTDRRPYIDADIDDPSEPDPELTTAYAEYVNEMYSFY
ncbi:hypothetical protein C8R46DRAFT_1221968 [Mycena filopes]|nr:hypothetical protein C8R46DRAFT_1221968 [Mycena filopes]